MAFNDIWFMMLERKNIFIDYLGQLEKVSLNIYTTKDVFC